MYVVVLSSAVNSWPAHYIHTQLARTQIVNAVTFYHKDLLMYCSVFYQVNNSQLQLTNAVSSLRMVYEHGVSLILILNYLRVH
jgi:hypothetical protein